MLNFARQYLVLLLALSGGAMAVEIDDSVVLAGAGGRELPVRVVYDPDVPSVATIVLSHGTFSSGKRYDAVAQHWAANGFNVILPDHRDANFAETPRSTDDMLAIVDSRVLDLMAIADQLDAVEAAVPALHDRLVGVPLVAAGHSVGTQVAMQVGGLRIRDPRDQSVREYAENRFSAVVLLSDPGKMAMMPEHTWRGSSIPTFMVTGPDDYGLMGDGRRVAEYQNEVLYPEGLDPEPLRVEMLVAGLDHQFGGLIHKKVAAEPDTEALALFNEYSTAFLLGILAPPGNTEAMLKTGRISARAELLVNPKKN